MSSGSRAEENLLNTWQLCNEIRNVLRDVLWAGSSNAVFGSEAVVVTVGPDVDVGMAIRFPAALIRPLDAAVDPEHSQQPNLIRQRIGLRLMTAVAGDALGEAPLIGGYWRSGDTQSDGRGLLEIEEVIYDLIRLLSADAGVEIQFMAAGASQAVLLEDLGYVAFRDYEFEAWVTASRDYPPATEFSSTVLTSGDVSITWVNPATGRYDFRRMVLRRAIGTVPPTSSGGVAIALSSDTATSHIDTPGAGTFTYAVFAAYDDRQDPPATDREFSDAATDPSAASPPSSLLTGLKAHWKCEEALGDLLDAHASNDLTITGAIGSVAGKLGLGRGIVGTAEEWHRSIVSGGDFDIRGATSMSVAMWVNMNAQTTDQSFCEIWSGTAAQQAFIMRYEVASDALVMHMSNGAGGSFGLGAGSAFPTGVYAFVGCAYDAVANEMRAYFNGTYTTTAGNPAGFPHSLGALFKVGGTTFASSNSSHDSISYYKGRALGQAEFDTLFNSGAALDLESF